MYVHLIPSLLGIIDYEFQINMGLLYMQWDDIDQGCGWLLLRLMAQSLEARQSTQASLRPHLEDTDRPHSVPPQKGSQSSAVLMLQAHASLPVPWGAPVGAAHQPRRPRRPHQSSSEGAGAHKPRVMTLDLPL